MKDKRSPILAETIIDDQPDLQKTVAKAGGSLPGEEQAILPHMATVDIPMQDKVVLAPGLILNQRFKLERCIGRGGMGTIFLARDLRREEVDDKDSLIAIKFLKEELDADRGAIVALQKEAKKSQALAHPNIVTVYDFDRENSCFYLSMEYLQGRSFDRVISDSWGEYNKENKTNKENLDRLISYFQSMTKGLSYAHSMGYVHADFKPANIFLCDNGQVKVLDFGIAQAVRGEAGVSKRSREEEGFSSMFAFTPDYASPEVLNRQPPEPSDDVFSLAVVAYELLSGRHPFRRGGERSDIKEASENGITVAPIPNVPKHIMAAMIKGLSFYREQRFQNATEFHEAIQPRNKVKYSFVAVVAFLVVISGVFGYLLMSKSEIAISIEDLPESMDEIVETIDTADGVFSQGDVEKAHRLYVSAWELGIDLDKVDSRDYHKLKVVLDRRIDNVIRHMISRSRDDSVNAYTLIQLQMALGFLKKDELGTLDQDIDLALLHIEERLGAR